ncbi:MAG: hypothetical protein R3330_04635 [Saprospiraceae bacterium]|nr:hypothetical protein [Saprospiraceae bacterium]
MHQGAFQQEPVIYDTTYRDKRIQQEIDERAGKPFGFLQRLRMKGIGSPRMHIRSASPEIQERLCQKFNLKHCNLELRRRAVIVWFGSFARTFAWVIPYPELSMVKNGVQLTIYGGGHFMNVADAHGGQIDHEFFGKLLEFKAEQLLTSFEARGRKQA